jgi:hypothetical protein
MASGGASRRKIHAAVGDGTLPLRRWERAEEEAGPPVFEEDTKTYPGRDKEVMGEEERDHG